MLFLVAATYPVPTARRWSAAPDLLARLAGLNRQLGSSVPGVADADLVLDGSAADTRELIESELHRFETSTGIDKEIIDMY